MSSTCEMESNNNKAMFMGIRNNELMYDETTTALESSNVLLDIYKYIEVVGYQIDQFMFDKFWQSIAQNGFILMDGTTMEWLGYADQANFIKLLKSHNVQFKQIKHVDPEFENYPKLVDEVSSMTTDALNRKQWIIIGSRDFRKMMMCIRTKKANQIREYYLSLEDLFRMYCEYTSHFISRDLNVARNVAVPKPNNKSQLTKIVLVKKSSNYKPSETDPSYVKDSDILVIRCQFKAVSGRMKKMRSMGNGTNEDCEIVLTLENPNPINLFIRFKKEAKHFDTHFKCCGYGIKLLSDDGEAMLIKTLQKVHDERMVYGSASGVPYPDNEHIKDVQGAKLQ